MLKSREIKEIMRNRGMEAGTIYCLEALAEQHIHITKRMMQLAEYFDKMVDSVGSTVNAVTTQHQEIERIKATMQNDDPDELGSNTQDLDRRN